MQRKTILHFAFCTLHLLCGVIFLKKTKYKKLRGIKGQLFSAQISLVLISTISFFILSSLYLYTQNTSKLIRDIKYTGTLSATQTDKIITQLENTIYYISVNSDIPKILASENVTAPLEKTKNRNNIIDEWTMIKSVQTTPIDFILYTDDGNSSILTDGINFRTISSLKDNDRYNELMLSKNRMLYSMSESEGTLSIMSKLYNAGDFSGPVGILHAAVDSSSIKNALNTASSKDIFNVLISDSSSITPNSEINLTKDDIELIKTNSKNHTATVKLSDNSRYFVISSDTGHSSFTLYTLAKINTLYSTIAVMLFILLLILIVVSIIAFLTAWRRSLPLVNAFNDLSGAMKKMNLGEFKKLPSGDELDDNIAETYSSFNHLCDTITSLIQYNSEYEESLKAMELNFLQQQIKPHFLYNTLNTMQGLVKGNDKEKVIKLINSLSRFYRLSLHNSDDFVELSTEITHITHYVNIENFKFNDVITLKTDIPEQLMSLKVPKLILQPLIENAIHHGIREKPDGCGTITVSAKEDNGYVFLYITDDGVGISRDKMENLKNGNGIGYINTDKRVRLFCGSDCGLDIESAEGKYTKITVKLKGKH